MWSYFLKSFFKPYIVKVLLALVLVTLVYSIGMPGCSPVQFADVTALSCEDMPTHSACQSKPVEWTPPHTPEEKLREKAPEKRAEKDS